MERNNKWIFHLSSLSIGPCLRIDNTIYHHSPNPFLIVEIIIISAISRELFTSFSTHSVTSIDNALERRWFLFAPSIIHKSCLFYFMTLPDVSPERQGEKTEARRDVRKNGWLFGLFCCWLQFCSLVSSCRYHLSFYDYSYRHKNLYCWRFFLMPSERMKCVKIYMRICVCAIRSGYSHEFLTKLWGVKWSKKGEVSNWWG